jgi:hypothetical protein
MQKITLFDFCNILLGFEHSLQIISRRHTMTDIVIVNGARTAMGGFQGALSRTAPLN